MQASVAVNSGACACARASQDRDGKFDHAASAYFGCSLGHFTNHSRCGQKTLHTFFFMNMNSRDTARTNTRSNRPDGGRKIGRHCIPRRTRTNCLFANTHIQKVSQMVGLSLLFHFSEISRPDFAPNSPLREFARIRVRKSRPAGEKWHSWRRIRSLKNF